MTQEPEPSTALVQQQGVGAGALAAQSPTEFVGRAAEMAKALASVIESQTLYVPIQGKKYVRVEGWTTLAGMLGVTPVEKEVSYFDRNGFQVFVATVEMINADGRVIARASAECGSYGDGPWIERADYAKRSMAVTRATSKACRLAFSWVMTLAGYEATPAEEVPDGGFSADPPSRQSQGAAARGSGPAPARRAATPAQANLKTMECPACGVVGSLIKGKAQYGGGFVCWKKAKTPGCGAKFADWDELTGASAPDPGGDIIDAEPIDVNSVRNGTVTTQDPGGLPEPIEPPQGLFGE